MATVDVPGVGPVDKRVLLGLGGAVVVVTGVIYWRRSQAEAAEGDAAVEAFDEGALTDTGEFGGGAGWQWAATPTGDVIEGSGSSAPRTNPEWTSRANEALIGAGYGPTEVAAALGKYLGRQPLSSTEAVMVRAALGFVGNPPEGTYAVTLAPATATPTPTTPKAPAAPSSVSVSLIGTDKAQLRWPAVAGATGYSVWRNGAHFGTTLGTALNVTGLKRGAANYVEVAATNGGGRWSARKRVTFTTKKK